jgi:putative glycosyltransferase (TIGR04348 family)
MPTIHLITPALAQANNGNWQTAYRWTKFLADRFEVITAKQWEPNQHATRSPEMLIALHARRSAASIAAFAKTGRPIVVVLTGTDLYRDIHSDPEAQRSLELADRLVVLHEQGIQDLPVQYRSKTRVIFQSARRLKPFGDALSRSKKKFFDLALVGHVRAEKDPMTALRAIQCLRVLPRSGSAKPTRLLHIGSDKDEALGHSFRQLASSLPEVTLKGNLSHAKTRQIIKRCDALILPSIMEGGANVLIEAARSGVPVIASRISGSVGMLGQDYLGYFEVGNDNELARLIVKCRDEPKFLKKLQMQCEKRSKLFDPMLEKRAVNALAAELMLTRYS